MSRMKTYVSTFRMDGPERFIGKIADCQLETIANAGHFVSMGKTERMCPDHYEFGLSGIETSNGWNQV